jgi:hypothetical protein
MHTHDYKSILGFTQEWLDLGVVTETYIEEAGRRYDASDDKNAEHCRFGAFRRYLASHRPLPQFMAEALYDLGSRDPDYSMGGAIMHEIAALPECPHSILELAATSDRKHLVKLVEKRRAIGTCPDCAER